MPETMTCVECGDEFEISEQLRERYPGWTPSRCRRCHRTRAAGGDGGGDGGGADRRDGRRRGGRSRATTPRPGRGGRRRDDGRGARVGGGGVLAPEEVLERYTAGPRTGVFTDGSADPNPGPGGWGAVYVVDDEIVDQARGSESHTTNNRMELQALIAGYDLVPPGEATTVYSDSNYCVRMINEWAAGWERNGWRRKAGPVKNLDLVKQLYERARRRPELELRWIKAHDGSRWNEYADALSVAYRRD